MHKKTVKLCGIAIVLILVFTVVISSNSFTKTAKAEDTPTSETSVNSGSDIHEQTLATDFNSNEEPMITFFTHGMAGDSGHWSNKLHRENGQYTTEGRLNYDPDSVLEKITRSLPTGTQIYKLNITSDAVYYGRVRREQDIYAEYYGNRITDFSQHTLILLEMSSINPNINDINMSHEVVYNHMHLLIDNVVKDFYNYAGKLPRINLIGFSRGGLINMDYAINHPKNVASLVSIATPYNGSVYDNETVRIIGVDTFDTAGGKCITGKCGHEYYFCNLENRKNAWNDTYSLNTHIKFHAISGSFSEDYLNKLINTPPYLEEGSGKTEAEANLIRFVASLIYNQAESSLLSNPGDFCVDVASQAATGYRGVISFHKEYTASNCNWDKRAASNFAVPHNLAPYDADVHNYILQNVQFGEPFLTAYAGEDKRSIVKANIELKNLYLQHSINGKEIVEIGEEAFANQTKLERVTIPDSVKRIRQKAFYNCTSLYYVSLPDNITDIFAETFAYTRLRTINLPRDLSEIGPGAFSNTELTSVTIPEGTRYIDYQAFENCIDLQRVSLPNTIRYISTFAFANCSDLEQIKLPENITEISNYTFKNCSSLTQINIPEKVTKIGKEAFSGCVKLRDLSFSENIINIGERAFEKCILINGVNIPNPNAEVAENAFDQSGVSNIVKLLRVEETGLCGISDYVSIRLIFDKKINSFSAANIEMQGAQAGSISVYNNCVSVQLSQIERTSFYLTIKNLSNTALIGGKSTVSLDNISDFIDENPNVYLLLRNGGDYYAQLIYNIHEKFINAELSFDVAISNNDYWLQLEQLEQARNSGANTIVIWKATLPGTEDTDLIEQQIQQARDEGLTVLMFYYQEIQTVADCLVLSDYYLAGYEQGQYVYETAFDEQTGEITTGCGRVDLFVESTSMNNIYYESYLAGFNEGVCGVFGIEEREVDSSNIKNKLSEVVNLAQKSSALIIYNGNLIEYVVNDLAYAIDSLKILMDTRQDELVLLQMGICDAIWYADQQTIAEIIEQFVNGNITDNVYYKPFTKVDIYNVDQYL